MTCWRCEAASVCPYYLPGAKCIYTDDTPARSPEVARRIRRAHVINWFASAATIASLLTAVGWRFA